MQKKPILCLSAIIRLIPYDTSNLTISRRSLISSFLQQLSPTFVGQGGGFLLFSWQTPYACGQTVPHIFTVTEEDTSSGGEEQDDKPDDEQELIQRPISGSRFRSTTTIILFSL
jgi:hypothetical protein